MTHQKPRNDATLRDLSREELEQVQGGRPMESLAINFTKIEYEAIVFVGGWGSSMYQYDFPCDY